VAEFLITSPDEGKFCLRKRRRVYTSSTDNLATQERCIPTEARRRVDEEVAQPSKWWFVRSIRPCRSPLGHGSTSDLQDRLSRSFAKSKRIPSVIHNPDIRQSGGYIKTLRMVFCYHSSSNRRPNLGEGEFVWVCSRKFQYGYQFDVDSRTQ